jgi:hypothetical protein
MRVHGIAGLRLRRRVRTTVPEPADQKVPDLLRRDFTAPAPNRRYVAHITYSAQVAVTCNLMLSRLIADQAPLQPRDHREAGPRPRADAAGDQPRQPGRSESIRDRLPRRAQNMRRTRKKQINYKNTRLADPLLQG